MEQILTLVFMAGFAYVIIVVAMIALDNKGFQQAALTIKQNKHYPNKLLFRLRNMIQQGTQIVFYFEFDKSCLYEGISGWNKVAGIHTLRPYKNKINKGYVWGNSVRLGWRSYGDDIRLCLYVRNKGRLLTKELLISAQPDKTYKCAITEMKTTIGGERITQYWCTVFDGMLQYTVALDVAGVTRCNFRLVSFPYFGGTSTAPHDMTILLSL